MSCSYISVCTSAICRLSRFHRPPNMTGLTGSVTSVNHQYSVTAVRQGCDLYNHIHACGKPCKELACTLHCTADSLCKLLGMNKVITLPNSCYTVLYWEQDTIPLSLLHTLASTQRLLAQTFGQYARKMSDSYFKFCYLHVHAHGCAKLQLCPSAQLADKTGSFTMQAKQKLLFRK